MKQNYINTKELESEWDSWLITNSSVDWEKLSSSVYKICFGVAMNFKPANPEEHSELAHEVFVPTLEKIKNKKLLFVKGKAPVFNLLTTAIIRHLFSLKTRESRHSRLNKTSYVTKLASRSQDFKSYYNLLK